MQLSGEMDGTVELVTKTWLRDFEGWELKVYLYVDWRRPQNIEALNTRPYDPATVWKLDDA